MFWMTWFTRRTRARWPLLLDGEVDGGVPFAEANGLNESDSSVPDTFCSCCSPIFRLVHSFSMYQKVGEVFCFDAGRAFVLVVCVCVHVGYCPRCCLSAPLSACAVALDCLPSLHDFHIV